MEYITHSPEETEALGAEYAKSLKAGDVVAFSGDLGAGKTAFTRGVLHGLGRIVLIEWSENAADVLPEAYKTVHIAYGDADNDRRITIGEVTV